MPYWEEDRMQNEAWSDFVPGVSWVEGGATTGHLYSGQSTLAYVYFTATAYGPNHYIENDFENGPGGNNYFPVGEHYIGSNIWYVTAGEHTTGYGEEPATASYLQAGLEEEDTNIANWGHLSGLSWWDPTTGVQHPGWSVQREQTSNQKAHG